MILINSYLDQIRAKGRLCFTKAEAMAALGISSVNLNARIYHLKKSGKLISPARNFYVLVEPENWKFGAPNAADLVIMLMGYKGLAYYACLLTAALYYGAAHQRPMAFQVMVSERMEPLVFGGVRVDFIYKKSLASLPVRSFAAKTGYLQVSSPELTAMDLLLYPAKAAGLGNIATVLYELIPAIDPDKLLELAIQTGSKAWVQRLGYILENLDADDYEAAKHKALVILKLEQYISRSKFSYIPLTPEIPTKSCKRNSKWRLIVNTTVESDL